MRTALRCIIVLLALPLFGSAPQSAPGGNAPDFLRLLPAAVAGWSLSTTDRVFNRETLATHLKDGAAAYLAYGFRRLLLREYVSSSGAALAVEVYDMSTAADAFGVFRAVPDGEEVHVGREALYLGGILRFWKGRFFARLTMKKETSGTREFLIGLGGKVAAAITEEGREPGILDCLPPEKLERRSIRYVHKQASLDGQFYLADENALLLDEGTEAVLGRYREARGESMLLVCRYRTPADARRAFLKFSRVYFAGKIEERGDTVVERTEFGQFAASRLAGPFLVLVLESPDRASCEALSKAAASRASQVFARPSGRN